MKVLSTVGAAAVSGFWKLGAIAALGVTIATGAGWAMAARDRDVARADIVKERKVSADLTAAVGGRTSPSSGWLQRRQTP